jgi:thymidylate kinase
MKDTLYIAVTGVHGSGKTTLCERLKHTIRREIGLDVAVGEEVARDCPCPVGLETTREAQDWIYEAHKRMELELRMEAHDVVIFDRTMLDNVLYAMRYIGVRGGHLDMAFTDQMDEAQGYLHNLDYNLVIRTHYVPELCVADARRDPDNAFAKQIEGLFDVFMAPFVDVDVMDVRETNVIQTTIEWMEDNL